MSTVRNKDGIEFDIDALATDVNGKVDKDLINCTVPYVRSRTPNEQGGVVEIWSDGYCVQTGYTTSVNTDTAIINLSQAFTDTNYLVTLQGYGSSSSANASTVSIISTSSFYARSSGSASNWNSLYYKAEGYIR